ncbi:MAG: hypothetical protein AB7T08_10270, partial [Hyphomonadaceae bacterium]
MKPANSPGNYKGDVGRLMVVMGAAIAFCAAVLLSVIAYAGWSANRSAAEVEQQQVENAFNRSITTALNEQKSIAWWDDAITNIR